MVSFFNVEILFGEELRDIPFLPALFESLGAIANIIVQAGGSYSKIADWLRLNFGVDSASPRKPFWD